MTRHFGEWGAVPPEGNVAPFSTINPKRPAGDRDNRKHHFVSITLMDGFTDGRGRRQAYRLVRPRRPPRLPPRGRWLSRR